MESAHCWSGRDHPTVVAYRYFLIARRRRWTETGKSLFSGESLFFVLCLGGWSCSVESVFGKGTGLGSLRVHLSTVNSPLKQGITSLTIHKNHLAITTTTTLFT
eukprot:GHVN01062380.1.p1 GENE.GHVN01062380.1~~GHVN01062380.1.p1  ORF type:complete len:104 (+),score=13.61 GHVN01062380.1:138-449(+)